MPEQNVPTTTEQAPASSESASKPSLGRVIAAWAVHAFTISGLAWATLALFAMLDNNIPMMSESVRSFPGSMVASSTTSSTT